MKRAFLNIVKFTIALYGILLVLELFVYHAGISRKSEVYFSEETGKAYTPEYNYVWFSEGFSMGSVNKGGYLGPFYKKEKAKGVKRVALLGDSYVEGFQVFDRDHFRKILENGLNRQLKDSAQVLNFGRSNFNFPNMFAYNEIVAKAYQPDLTLFFVSREDLNSLTTDALLPNVLPTTLKSVSYLSNAEASSFVKANALLSNSALIYMLNSARRTILNQGIANTIFDGKFFQRKNEAADSKSIQPINIKLFEKLNRENVLLVYREKTPLPNDMRIAMSKAGIQLIDLSTNLSLLEQMGCNPNEWFNQSEDGHWNVKGHQEVGAFLASSVASKLD